MNSSSRITTTCDDFLSSIAYDSSNEMNARARSVHLLESRFHLLLLHIVSKVFGLDSLPS